MVRLILKDTSRLCTVPIEGRTVGAKKTNGRKAGVAGQRYKSNNAKSAQSGQEKYLKFGLKVISCAPNCAAPRMHCRHVQRCSQLHRTWYSNAGSTEHSFQVTHQDSCMPAPLVRHRKTNCTFLCR